MGILSWIVLGLIAGVMAKWLMPGRQGGGLIFTTALGVVGAMVGGYLSTQFLGFGGVGGFDLRSMAIAIGGAMLLLFLGGLASRASD